MASVDLSPYDITTAKPKADGCTALTVPGHRIAEISEFARYEQGCAVLWAPTSGATTASVQRTRCELKSKPFKLADGDRHTAQLTVQVDQVNWKGSFVLIQAHCHDGNDPTLKGFIETKNGRNATFKIGLRTGASTEAPPKQVVYEGVELAKPFTVRVSLSCDGEVLVSLQQGERAQTFQARLSEGREARPHVFHWGAYNQVDQGHQSEPPSDGTQLRVLHVCESHLPLAEPSPSQGEVFAALIEAAALLPRQAKLLELNRITDLIDQAELPDAVSGKLYLRIKALKAAS